MAEMGKNLLPETVGIVYRKRWGSFTLSRGKRMAKTTRIFCLKP